MNTPPPYEEPDVEDAAFAYEDVVGWGNLLGWTPDQAAADLDLALDSDEGSPPTYTVRVLSATNQSKRNRNRAWAIWLLGR